MATKKESVKKKRNERMRYQDLKTCIPFIHAIKSVPSKYRPIILDHLDNNSREILYATIEKVVKAKPETHTKGVVKKVKKYCGLHKDKFRYLSKVKGSSLRKKKILSQVGGFPLAAILSTAVPILIDYISKRL